MSHFNRQGSGRRGCRRCRAAATHRQTCRQAPFRSHSPSPGLRTGERYRLDGPPSARLAAVRASTGATPTGRHGPPLAVVGGPGRDGPSTSWSTASPGPRWGHARALVGGLSTASCLTPTAWSTRLHDGLRPRGGPACPRPARNDACGTGTAGRGDRWPARPNHWPAFLNNTGTVGGASPDRSCGCWLKARFEASVPPRCPQTRNASTSINGSKAFAQLKRVEPRGLEPLTPTLPAWRRLVHVKPPADATPPRPRWTCSTGRVLTCTNLPASARTEPDSEAP
jgi:hypothetical protein